MNLIVISFVDCTPPKKRFTHIYISLDVFGKLGYVVFGIYKRIAILNVVGVLNRYVMNFYQSACCIKT